MDELQQALAKGAAEAIKDLTKELIEAGATFGKKQIAKLSIDFEYGFNEYLERNLRRLSQVKTLLNPNSPVSLDAAYVPPNLEFEDSKISEKTFLSRLKNDRFFVITGIGGTGKSFFLKHLFIKHCNEPLGRVPIFVELRHLKPEISLIDYMAQQISSVAPSITDDLFRYALKLGKFILFLDGFDEVEPSFRDDLARQVIQLSYQFDKNAIVLTSRPDGPFGSWNEFHVAGMAAFDKEQVISLISKLEYEQSSKNQFLNLVRTGLYATHREYLSNPLLCTLMLLTFDQGAEIPSKLHVFFERAFEALFYKHDATKETSFRRKFKTSLTIDAFRLAFAAFSAFCYLDYGSSFDHSQAIISAKQALEYNEVSDGAENFISDLCTSVSILIREGDHYNYIHRSFQEFFVAQFLAYREIDEWDALVQHIVVERPNDSVVRLLAEINKDRFEKQFLAPRIKALRADIDAIDISRNPAAAFGLFYITFSIRDGSISSWTVGRSDFRPKWHHMVRFVEDDWGYTNLERLAGFDWGEHFANLGIELKEGEPGGDELPEVSDRALFGTPMMGYLDAVKKTVAAMDERLRATAENQRRLVSSALLKK